MSGALPALSLVQPTNVADAISIRRQYPKSRFIAGGTDLVAAMRRGLFEPDLLIDLSSIDELAKIERSPQGLRIGAGVTIAALARSTAMASEHRAVCQAAGAIAGPGHRSMGTIGGNLCLDTRCMFYNQSDWWRRANGYCLKRYGDVCHVAPQGQRCHAAFTGDLAPALLVLDAQIEIAGREGTRCIPLGELYVEDGRAHLTLADDEIIVAVRLPAITPPSTYGKVRVRGAIDYPLAGVAVALRLRAGAVESIRIALTGTNSRPFVLNGTDSLVGRPVDDHRLQQIERLVQKQVRPMRTTITSAQHRRVAAAALASRLVDGLAAEQS